MHDEEKNGYNTEALKIDCYQRYTHTLKPPAVPALMIRSGCNAWIEA